MYSSYGVLPLFWTCLNCICNVLDFIAAFSVHDFLHDGTLDEGNPVHVGCNIKHGPVDEQGDKQGTVDEQDTHDEQGDEEGIVDEQGDKQGTVDEEGIVDEQDTVGNESSKVDEQASKGDEEGIGDNQGTTGIDDEQDSIGNKSSKVDEQASKVDEQASKGEEHGAPLKVTPLRIIGPTSRLVVLDLNGLLLKRYKINYYRGQPRGFATLPKGHVFKVVIPPKTKKQQYQYVIRPDASAFILSLYQQFSVTIWSSCTKQNLTTSLNECFSDISR